MTASRSPSAAKPRQRLNIRNIGRFLALVALLPMVLAGPARAQSVLRDAETEALLYDMSREIITAAGLSPRTVKIVMINDDTINAFVVGGQVVYIHSGLLAAADNASEVQGVIAHEVAHIADGHVITREEGARPAVAMTLLSMVLGIAAMAVGAGEAGMAAMAAGQTAAMGKFLAFTRVQEATADASGIRYLDAAGVTGKGMLSFFKKLQSQEFRYGLANIDPFAQSHPLSGARLANMTADVQRSKFFAKSSDPGLDERLRRVKAKLMGYAAKPTTTLNVYPVTDTSVYGRYARAYAYHKSGYPDRADAEADALIAKDPHDPYFLEIQGQILLEAGKPQAALKPLREATQRTNYSPLIATTFGHALIATEDPANYPEAIKVLRQAVARDDENPFAWYQLGTAYERTGDEARVALATAERAAMSGNDGAAAVSARRAMIGLTPNTPDWIRAQDIAMTSGFAAQENRKRRN